jgi:hypothetical protein
MTAVEPDGETTNADVLTTTSAPLGVAAVALEPADGSNAATTAAASTALVRNDLPAFLVLVLAVALPVAVSRLDMLATADRALATNPTPH